MKKILTLLFIAILGVGCVNQKFEIPETKCTQNLTATKTIHDLKAMLTGDTLHIPNNNIVIEGYVTSTDQYGNFYKELVIQDSTDAISIMLDASYLYTKFPLGQKVFVKCDGLYLGNDYGITKLGATYVQYGIKKFGRIQGNAVIDQHIFCGCENSPVSPKSVSLDNIDNGLLYKLIKIDNVQFALGELGQTWADANNLESVNHTIYDQNGNKLLVRTSGYANFARQIIPDGNGSITGILTKYNSDYQLLVRNSTDAKMSGTRFADPYYLLKNFEDQSICSGGWRTYVVKGVAWQLGYYSGNNFVKCSNYSNGTHIPTETWYISPELNLNYLNSPVLSFRNTYNYSGDPLKVKYSTDYTGEGDPNNATWTDLSPTLSSGNWSWTNSGNLALPKETKFVAFVYTGSSSSGSTWEVDDIKISDN